MILGRLKPFFLEPGRWVVGGWVEKSSDHLGDKMTQPKRKGFRVLTMEKIVVNTLNYEIKSIGKK